MTTRSTKLIAVAVFAGLTTACATTAPVQLVEARAAYDSSSKSVTAKLAPTELYDAKRSLDQANKEFDEKGDTLTVRDQSYVATRKFQLADVKARTELDRQRIAEAVKAGVVVRDTQVKDTQAALASTREELKEERRDNNTNARELQKSSSALNAEKEARQSAEGKLAGAMKDLATIAAIKEDSRGTVISLSGSVLFASGQYALLNTAMTKLDQVGEALKTLEPEKRMVVEGHTDSRGSDRTNQPLSLNRAVAVRNYLVSRGVDSDKITSVGMGSAKPIVDNLTAENRANNRRVEIVIGASRVSTR